jgi:hypothetical protein
MGEELIDITPRHFYETYVMSGEAAQRTIDRELSHTFLGNLSSRATLEAQSSKHDEATQGEVNG